MTTDQPALGKVPAVTLGFWVIKILATTLGETGCDMVSMSMGLGYPIAIAIFGGLFVAAIAGQIAASRFHPFLFWLVIVATTTVGTALADYVDRSLGIGYLGGSSILLAALLLTLAVWRLVLGSVAIDSITSRKAETCYWVTILCSQTLGTALGDWTSSEHDEGGLELGYAISTLIFGSALALVAAAYCWTGLSHAALFWAAFIFTRPLGATLGDLLDKPHDGGGLGLSRYLVSGLIAVAVAILILLLPQRASAKRA
jgi:uncharacterized membrane-anchored protein